MTTALTLAVLLGLGAPALALDDLADDASSDKVLDAAEGPRGLTDEVAARGRRCVPRHCTRGPARPGPRTAPPPRRPVVHTAPPSRRVVVRPPPRRVVPPRTVLRTPPRVVVSRPPPVRVAPPRIVRPAPARVVVDADLRIRSRTVVVRRAHPWHGIFVYGPRPVHHHHYHAAAPQPVEEEHLPERKVDRGDSIAVGIKSGSYLSAYEGGSSYGDFGLGLVGRWRPEEALGLELAVTHHDETWNTASERSQTLGQGSVMLFANPWGRVQPYVLAGLSANARRIDDAVGDQFVVQAKDTLWGPHAGAGIEFAFGQRAALDLEARYVGWMNDPERSLPGGLQTSANVVMHF